jgi:hypothetical protein
MSLRLKLQQQEVGLDDAKALEMIYEAMARKIRIRLLESGVATEQLDECFNLEEKLLDEIRSNPTRQAWTLDQNVAVNQRIGALGDLYRQVLKSEMHAGAG